MWALGSSVAQTVFDAGRRRATSEAALANYDATVASYREATLDAFQQVEDNLAALRILEQEAEQQKRAAVSAQESLQLFTNRYIGGVDNYPSGHHCSDNCFDQRTQRCRYLAAPYGRQRNVDQGTRRRLERRGSAAALKSAAQNRSRTILRYNGFSAHNSVKYLCRTR